jgi:beta-lactamase regulating signal transducer with metallopeptidase domain
MNWDTIATSAFCSRLCLALLHSVWLIGLLAIAGRGVAFLLRKRSVEVQYALYVALLIGSLVTLPLTFLMVDVTGPVSADRLPGHSPQALPEGSGDSLKLPTADGQAGDSFNHAPAYAASPPANVLETTQAAVQNAAHSSDIWSAWSRWSPLVMGLYVTGVLAMLARLVTGVWRANQLRLRAETIHEGPLVDLLRTAATRWSMRVVPKLARAGEIVVPVVVGLIRPTILLPMSATTSLSLDELELILAHELAHVHRYDLWINLLQRLAETLLFFNPAVWHISSRVGTLREYCCDEMVCRTMSETPAEPRPRYASALLRVVELAQNSSEPTTGDRTHSELATLAAGGKSPSELRRRVARLFGEPLREPLRLSRGGMVTLVALLLALLVGPVTWQSEAGSGAVHSDEVVKETGAGSDDEVVSGKQEDSNAVVQDARTNAEAKESAQFTFPITVSGHAVDEDGNAISGAKIYLASPRTNSESIAITESDRDGAYRFEKVPLPITRATTNKGRDAGSFEVFGEADGHGFAWRPLKSFSPGSEHESERNWAEMHRRDLPTWYGRLDPIDLDLTFGDESKLRGRIVDDQGQPIADTALAIRQCDPEWNQDDFNRFASYREFTSLNERALVPPRIKVRHTDSQGRFEFDKLPANCRFWIDVRPPGHTPRKIWAVTRARAKKDAKGNRVYSGNFDAVFARPRRVKLRVVYGDTGKPAPRVGVGGMVVEASFWKTTDEDGFVEVPLPDGRYQLGVSPRYRTPYLRMKFDVVVSAETAEKTTTVKLRPAAQVDITVRDADTGNPLAGVDLWIDEDIPGGRDSYRKVHGYRSWEVETRISHYESPRSNKNGKMRVLFAPGKHRIGVGLEAYPEGYVPVDPNGREIDCQTGRVTAVEFQMTRSAGVAHPVKNDAALRKPATEPKKKGPSKKEPQRFELLVRGPDGLPVPHASVELRTRPFPTVEQIVVGKFIRASTYGPFVQTNAEGRLVLELPKKPIRFNVSIKTAGYGPYWASWNSEKHPQSIPSQFVADLDAGWSVGGVVVNDSGQPVEGIEVHPSVNFKKRPGDTDQLGVGTRIVTDSNGKWRFDNVPVSKNDIHVAVSHPDYQPLRRRLSRNAFEVKRDAAPTGHIELKRGMTVSGTVTDETGDPIEGALVRTKFHNDIRKAKTDKRGVFRLVACEPRMARIVVSAKGRATDMQEVRVDPDMAPINFSMKPGGKIRVRVVDEQGNGIPKARIFFQRWRGRIDYFEFDHVSQYADENGVWEWNEAPLDEFKADICRPGGMQLSKQSLIAREEEFVFKPPRALVVSGSVADARTKEPIKKFRVIPGLRNSDPRIGMNWLRGDSYEASDGEYRIRSKRGYPAHLVRIEAEGYKVAISRDIMTDEGDVEFDFELQPAKDIVATILTATGEPAAYAKIALGIAGSQINIKNGDIDQGSTYATRLDAAADGRFSIPARDEPFQLVITHRYGFAHLKSAEEPIPRRLTLTPWARVEGTFRVGAQPAPNVVLTNFAEGIHSYGDDVPNIFTQYDVMTGKGGRFVFKRVFPGSGRIGRRILLMVDEGATEVISSQRVSAEFIAGKTTTLDLGGTGRPVVGKLAPPANYSDRVLWNFALLHIRADLKPPQTPKMPADVQEDPDQRKTWWDAWRATDDGKAWTSAYKAYQQLSLKYPYITASVDRDGSFRIDDVPAGNYVLGVNFSKKAAGTLSGHRFSVPPVEEGRTGEPLELGTLTLDKQ